MTSVLCFKEVEPYFGRRLSSIPTQSYKDKVICIDDGSTDGSSNILKRLSEVMHERY